MGKPPGSKSRVASWQREEAGSAEPGRGGGEGDRGTV